jgi:hypothetical protein
VRAVSAAEAPAATFADAVERVSARARLALVQPACTSIVQVSATPLAPWTAWCEACGGEFARDFRRLLLCDGCRRERMNARRRVRHEPRVCPACDEAFVPLRRDRLTCGRAACRQRFYRARKRAQPTTAGDRPERNTP